MGSSSGLGIPGDWPGYCCSPSAGSMSPGVVLSAVVPLLILEASTGVCVSSVAGVVRTTFVISVSTWSGPDDAWEWNTVTVTRGSTLAAGVVSGFTAGGVSPEWPRRGLAPSTNTFAATVVSTSILSAAFVGIWDWVKKRDVTLLSHVSSISIGVASVTKEVVYIL